MTRLEAIRELSSRLRSLPLTASVRQLRLLGAALVRESAAQSDDARLISSGDEIESCADRPRPPSEGWEVEYGQRCGSEPFVYYLYATTPDLLAGEIRRHIAVSHPECPPAVASALLRDVLDNVFAPVAFDPGWRTEAVVGLARGMYETRDFAPMPVLADALEDAGCANPDVLAHCRGGPHVRGCWVVDLVLGKA
jgi:hypothetical protein